MQNNIIKACNKYMLTNENMLKIEKTDLCKKDKDMTPPRRRVNISPSSNVDNLFWCFYIILNGEYNYTLDSSFKKEKEFKIESIEKLRKIKSELKAFKLRLNEIENELLNEKKITIKSLLALCLLYKINILYVWDRKYIELINDPDATINIILNENKEDKISYDTNIANINYYRENYWFIENITKPLKGIANYNHSELLTIAKKLDITNMNNKKTKKEIYEKILEKL